MAMITNLSQYEFTNREEPVSNEDDCTAVAPSRALTPSAARVSENIDG